MYRGFNLELDNSFTGVSLQGQKLAEVHRQVVREGLDGLVDTDDVLNGARIGERWFPQIPCEIFISHSHKDQDLAIRLAGWLKNEFEIEAFIDSTVWGYAGELLKRIDDKYCRLEKPGSYSYEKSCYSAAHVHMILGIALTQMLYNTECLLFLNTPASLRAESLIDETESAWIYHELATANMIQRQTPTRHRGDEAIVERYQKNAMEARATPSFVHPIQTDFMSKLNGGDLLFWKHNVSQTDACIHHPLDSLYDL